MVDLVWPHIKFINIRPLEGGVRVFICILWRISRFLTTRLAKRPTYGVVLHSGTKILFASYSRGFKLSFEPGSWIFPQFLKKAAQERPSPGPWIPIFQAVRGSLYFKRSMDPYISSGPWISIYLTVRGSLYFKRSLDPYVQSGPWTPIFWSVHGSLYFGRSMDPYILSGLWSLYSERSVDPYISDRSVDPYILAGPSIPIFLTGPWSLYS